jgi:hypothetical protein
VTLNAGVKLRRKPAQDRQQSCFWRTAMGVSNFVGSVWRWLKRQMAENCQFPIIQCDVPQERCAALESYRAKRREWLAWLDTDEHHAIWTTISAMVWTDVSFRTLTQLAIDDEQSCLSNTLVAEQMINGHVATQVLAIRRLVDNRRDVISLRRLIKDLRSNFSLFTRENYVCHDGLPYDYEAVMQKEMAAKAGKGFFWGATTGPDAHGTSRMAHEQFDKLAGVDPTKRRREDRLPTALLDRIDGWLDSSGADGLAEWSHAYLAHAGTRESRARIADAMVSTNKITDAIRIFARVTEAISAYVLFAGGRLNSLMPTAQFDVLESLDKPAMQPDRKDDAYSLWDRLSTERDRYLDGVDTELTSAAKADGAAS